MNPAIVARWVAALRSGRYMQGQQYLNTPGQGFCCLGVLCDLHREDGLGTWAPGTGPYTEQLEYAPDGADPEAEGDVAGLPAQVMSWAGITRMGFLGDPHVTQWQPGSNVPVLPPLTVAMQASFGGASCLAGANDTGATFAQLADFIERHHTEF